MRESHELHQLIRSLSMSEKRHFKIFVTRHVIGEENNYVKIFIAIEKQKKGYDEKKVLLHFKDEHFVNHFPVVKNYLLHLILKSLRSFHSGTSVNMQLREMLDQAEILFEKAEPELCRKILAKAKKIAIQHEKFGYILDVLYLEKQLTIYFGQDLFDSRILEQEAEVIAQRDLLNQYETIFRKVYRFTEQEGHSRNQKDFARLKKTMSHPLMKDEKRATGYRARSMYLNAMYTYYYLTRDHQRSYESRKKHIEHLESQPWRIEDNIEEYVGMVNNFLLGCLRIKNFSEHEAVVAKLKLFGLQKKRTVQVNAFIFQVCAIQELDRHTYTGNFENVTKALPEIIKELDLYSGKLMKGYELGIYCNIALCLFGCAQYKKALPWVNKVLNDRDTSFRIDVYAYTRILNLLIHFEMGNEEYLESAIKSTYRFLVKRNNLYLTEKLIIDFIRKKVPKISSRADQLSAFRWLRSELLKAWRDPYEAQVKDYFDFVSWLESKIEGRPFADCVRRKALS